MSASVDTSLTAVALVIALVALVTALGQLLQQYFATADGYRRCHKSVMGEYAQKTRLHWRWREFRFETLYTTPELFLAGDGAPNRVGQVLLTGSKASRKKSMVPVSSMEDEDIKTLNPPHLQSAHGRDGLDGRAWLDPEPKRVGTYKGELACWVPLLHWIHDRTAESLSDEQKFSDPLLFPPGQTRLPAVIFRERSWDFQPPDVVRPLAKTTLSDIAIIARRMGMKWKEFRPSDGILRAEGHSHTITSTVVRSLGIVLQYSYTGQGQRLKMAERNLRNRVMASTLNGRTIITEQEEIYIPRARADRLGCGVIRTDRQLGLPDFTVSTQSEIVTALSLLERTGTASATLSKIIKEHPEFQFRIADLVALTTPPARFHGSSFVQVSAPSDNMCGVTTSSVGRRAFRQCLEEHIVAHKGDVGIHTQEALQICHNIGTEFAAWDHTDQYSTQDEEWIVTRDPRYLDIVQDHIQNLTFILNNMEQHHTFRYLNLIGIHIRVAIFCEGGETSMVRNWGADYKADVDGYFRLLPVIVEEMRKTGFYDRQMIVDAWVTMMLRAMCWGACHFFVPGERVPIQYFGSQLPVYIG